MHNHAEVPGRKLFGTEARVETGLQDVGTDVTPEGQEHALPQLSGPGWPRGGTGPSRTQELQQGQ